MPRRGGVVAFDFWVLGLGFSSGSLAPPSGYAVALLLRRSGMVGRVSTRQLGSTLSRRLAAVGCPVGRGEIGLKPDLRGAVPITPLLGLGGDSPPLLAEWGLAFIPLLSERRGAP